MDGSGMMGHDEVDVGGMVGLTWRFAFVVAASTQLVWWFVNTCIALRIRSDGVMGSGASMRVDD